MSDVDCEFDFWPEAQLQALAANLKPHTSEDAPFLTAKLPAEKDLTFWGRVAVECMPDEAKETSEADLGAALANAVHCELGSRDVTLVDKGLWIGDLSVPESRLATAHLGVKGVVTVASHPVEPLWNIDKVSYLSLVVGTADRLRTQLAACAEFALANEPCLICCSSGSSLSVLCAAACVAARSKGAIGAGAALEAVSAKRGRVDLPADGEAELAAFCRDHQETGATHPYPVNVGVARSNSTGKRDAEAESPLTPASKAAKALGSTSLDVA